MRTHAPLSESSSQAAERTKGRSLPAVSPLLQRKEEPASDSESQVVQRVQMTYNSGDYTLILTDEIRDHIWERHGSDAWGALHDDNPGVFAAEFLPAGKAALDGLAQHLFVNGEWAGGEVYLNYGVATGWGYNGVGQLGYYRGVRMFCNIDEDGVHYTISTIYPKGGFVVYVAPEQQAAEQQVDEQQAAGPVADAPAVVVHAQAVDGAAPPEGVAAAVVDNAQQAEAVLPET